MSRGTAERVVPAPLVAPRHQRRFNAGDRVFLTLAYTAAFLVFLIAGIFLLALFVPALPAITRFGLDFFVSRVWDPVRTQFGALPAIYGTVVTAAIGIVLAFPVGLGAALFLAEENGLRLIRGPLSFAVELLAAIPSVVIGLWAFFILTPIMRDSVDPFLNHVLGFLPLFAGSATGYGFLTAGVVLAIMVLPIMTALSRDVIRAVPRALREASLALGATRAETIWSVVLPYARVGVTGAVLLSLGRALGETIAVYLIISLIISVQPHILQSGGSSISALIASKYAEATELGTSALMAAGLALFVLTLVINFAASMVVARSRSGAQDA